MAMRAVNYANEVKEMSTTLEWEEEEVDEKGKETTVVDESQVFGPDSDTEDEDSGTNMVIDDSDEDVQYAGTKYTKVTDDVLYREADDRGPPSP